MNSSPVLRQQSQNKIQSDHSRMRNEFSKMTGGPTASKHLALPPPSKDGAENQDPAAGPQHSLKGPVKPGISRLPVLAKSFSLQASSEFTQSHKRWEENPLVGKSKRNRTMTQNHRLPLVSTSRAGPQATQQSEKTVRAARLKTTQQPQPKSSAEQSAGQHSAAPEPGPFALAQHNRGPTQAKNKDLRSATASARPALSTESCLSHLQMLSLKDRCETTSTTQPGQCPASVQQSSGMAGSGEAFCPDPGALLSILKNKGISAAGAPGSKTPLAAGSCSQAPSYGRVSIMSRHKAGLPTGPSTESILGNEEAKAEGLLRATPRNTACPTGRPSVYTPQRVPVTKSHSEATAGPVGSGEAFCPDPGALRSILQNEGISAAGAPGSKTPLAAGSRSQAPSYGRVSIMKSQQKTGPRPAGPTRESILGNEEAKAEGLPRATPRNTACPTGRPSVYMAQRVPVTKSRSEATAGPVDLLKGTPGRVPARHQPMSSRRLMSAPRTPYAGSPKLRGLRGHVSTELETHTEAQRVPVTKSRSEATAGPVDLLKGTPGRVPARHQPMSSRRLMSAPRTPYAGSPKLRGLRGHISTELETHTEEVIQRLFMETDQEEEEQTMGDDVIEPGTKEDMEQASSTEFLHSATKGPSWSLEEKEEEQSTPRGQPFFQAPQRGSVIFFSTGKKLFRAAAACDQEGGDGELEHQGGVVTSSSQGPPPVHPGRHPGPDTPSVPSSLSDATRQIGSSILGQLRGVVQKDGALSSVAALLRRRLPPVDELRLDEEVATYTCATVPPSSSSSSSSCSLRPRCGNPVAWLLHSQESTTFAPIMDDLPASSNPSPLRER